VQPSSMSFLQHTLRLVRVAFAAALASSAAHAQTTPLLNEVHTISATGTAAPVEHQFTLTAAGQYTLTLTDLGAALQPSAPVASIKLALTNGSSIVGTPLSAGGTLQFNGTPGTYGIHVVGTPGSGLGSGSIGILVTDSGKNQVAAFSDQLAVPPQPVASSQDDFSDTFTVQNSGAYQIKITDLQFPQALNQGILALTAQGSSSLVATLDISSNPQQTVNLTSGVTYSVFAIGVASSSALGGLYNILVTSSADASITYSKTRVLGGVSDLGQLTLTAGASYSLNVADLAFPAALTQVGAVVVQNATLAAAQLAAGSAPFVATTTGRYEAYSLATPATAPGVGSYSVQVKPQSGAALLSVARAVTAVGNASAAFSFDTTIPAAGAYVANLQNFSFPLALTSVSMAVAQNGALVGALQNGTGSVNINAAAGPITLLAVAQAASGSGGLFDVNLTGSGSSTLLFDATQAVGTYFVARKITVTSAGTYDVSAADVGFPAPFTNFDVAVTQGTSMLGQIASVGKFSFTASPGDYFVNFMAQPATSSAGTYSLNVVPKPAAPVVTLSASPTHVNSGGTTTLTWSTQNATSCTASGGWTGSQALSGTFTTSALTTATTFTLTCAGPDESANQSVTVSIDAASGGGGGGGGALDEAFLLAVAVALGLRAYQLRAGTSFRD